MLNVSIKFRNLSELSDFSYRVVAEAAKTSLSFISASSLWPKICVGWIASRRGEGVARTDLHMWTKGIVLYEHLMGMTPFEFHPSRNVPLAPRPHAPLFFYRQAVLHVEPAFHRPVHAVESSGYAGDSVCVIDLDGRHGDRDVFKGVVGTDAGRVLGHQILWGMLCRDSSLLGWI